MTNQNQNEIEAKNGRSPDWVEKLKSWSTLAWREIEKAEEQVNRPSKVTWAFI